MKTNDMRRRIAHEAARLLAEDGGLDYGFAKRKAARQLGAADSRNLPDNREVEEALRSYHSLYQGQEQRDRLAFLREIAVEYMEKFADFDPHLTGPVMNGTAGRHSEVNLQLFTDNEKELEFFLMNMKTNFKRSEIRFDGQIYPHYSLQDSRASIELTVYPTNDLRQMPRHQANGTLRRIRLPQVRMLLQSEQ
ncbi:MAG: hypothetical protein HXY27_00695 [Hydrogenophilaceae bacterium]|jgi:hypothetical protein|nr:hypothetical protein [Hydrogenophilaceae bacterium]